ncbi:MAG: CocE/NonD family hydrolase [Anaerolineae bacterium]
MPYKSLIVERDVEMAARDGTILRADVYRPNTQQAVPVLLQRTPYSKTLAPSAFVLTATERGYAVVVQDTRGRWASEGKVAAFEGEKTDGYDTVQWAASRPWADGGVGMFGGSYVGYTQMMAASQHPPALKTIIPSITFCDPRTCLHPGGAPGLGVALSWGLTAQGQMALQRHEGDEDEKAEMMRELITAIDGMVTGESFRRLPLVDTPVIGHDGIYPFLSDVISLSRADTSFWQGISASPEEIEVPALHVGGWYDIFAKQTVDHFVAIKAAGRTDQKLLMGPWLHGPLSSFVGDVDFTFAASDAAVLSDELQLRWFDHWLKGVDNGIMEEPPVRIFVMGDNVWRSEESWPLARAKATACYLHSGGAANSLRGDGTLSFDVPGDEPIDTFVYDPRNPVPTRGGGLCCSAAALAAGAFDQHEVEERPDVLVYTSAPLDKDVEVTGPVRVHLWATTSARDTDFTAKLVDVEPCGYARNLCDGIIRARYRTSLAEPHLVEPHAVLEYTIELGPTSNVVKAGHRIRLEISSSNFPKYARNTNTGGPIGTETELRPAVQTVLHDAEHASYLEICIV